eukprot:3917709-Rhodomonas_salina.1
MPDAAASGADLAGGAWDAGCGARSCLSACCHGADHRWCRRRLQRLQTTPCSPATLETTK